MSEQVKLDNTVSIQNPLPSLPALLDPLPPVLAGWLAPMIEKVLRVMEMPELQGKTLQLLLLFLKLSICGPKARVSSVSELFLVQEREEDCPEALEKAPARNVLGCQIPGVVLRTQSCWSVCWAGLALGRPERCWSHSDPLLKSHSRYFS